MKSRKPSIPYIIWMAVLQLLQARTADFRWRLLKRLSFIKKYF